MGAEEQESRNSTLAVSSAVIRIGSGLPPFTLQFDAMAARLERRSDNRITRCHAHAFLTIDRNGISVGVGRAALGEDADFQCPGQRRKQLIALAAGERDQPGAGERREPRKAEPLGRIPSHGEGPRARWAVAIR